MAIATASEWLSMRDVNRVANYALVECDENIAIFDAPSSEYHRSWTGERCLRDQLRNMRLLELGWEVRRFWVYEVRDQLDDCFEWVRRWAADAEGASA